MAELITLLIEAIVGFFAALLRLLPFLFELLIYLLAGAIAFLAYVASPTYRRRKQTEWEAAPWKKYLQVGTSTLSLLTLIAIAIWIARPAPPRGSPIQSSYKKPQSDEDLRLQFNIRNPDGTTNESTVSVKKGGLKKMFETSTLTDLSNIARQNIKLTPPQTTQTNSPP